MEAFDVRGRFVWHQLLTRDVPGAKKFYPSLTGWKAQPWPLDPSYTVCVSEDAPTAGIMAFTPDVPADAPPHWMQYIGTRDVDGTAEAAVRAGGSIVKEPGDMKGAGRYAVLKDPQGGAFAVIDPENSRPEGKGVPPLGQFSWHELATTDNEAAFAFYSNLFGWDAIRRMDMGSMGVYLVFGYDGEQKGGMYIKRPEMPGPPHWLPYVRVPDVDSSAPAVEAAGGRIILPPMDVPGGSRITIINDPAGAVFALHSYPDAEGPAAAPGAGKAESAAKAKAKSKSKAKAKAKARMKSKSKAKAKTKARSKAKSRSPARKSARGKSKSKARARTKARARAKKKVARRKK
jgi:predicted enzyme related to lactoylglutathione lyase